MRRWRAAHPAEHSADVRDYYARHREERLRQSAAYHRAHPEVGLARSHNYRARRRAAEGHLSPREWLDLVAQYDGRCAYCGGSGPLEADHRVPLARGGTNLIDNILPACRPCNARQHLLTESEFRARLAAERASTASASSGPLPHQVEERADQDDREQT